MPLPAELQSLADALDANERDARALVSGLSEAAGTWRAQPGSWSVAECLDHLAVANRVYVDAMRESAERARAAGRRRRRPAKPGLIGRLFVRSMEPPVRYKGRAPRTITPRPSPPLGDAFNRFLASQDVVRAFLRSCADIDLNAVRFRNPFIGAVHFSLATGLHVIPAHERRHLWQAWNVRRAHDAATGKP